MSAWLSSLAVAMPGRDHRRVEARRHAEDRARRLRAPHHVFVEQRSRADDGLGHLAADRLDRLRRRRGAEGHLQNRQPAADQRLGERNRLLRLFYHDDGHNARLAQSVNHVHVAYYSTIMWYNTTTQAMETALETFTKRFAPPGWKTGGGVSIPSLTGAADAFLAVVVE